MIIFVSFEQYPIWESFDSRNSKFAIWITEEQLNRVVKIWLKILQSYLGREDLQDKNVMRREDQGSVCQIFGPVLLFFKPEITINTRKWRALPTSQNFFHFDILWLILWESWKGGFDFCDSTNNFPLDVPVDDYEIHRIKRVQRRKDMAPSDSQELTIVVLMRDNPLHNSACRKQITNIWHVKNWAKSRNIFNNTCSLPLSVSESRSMGPVEIFGFSQKQTWDKDLTTHLSVFLFLEILVSMEKKI